MIKVIIKNLQNKITHAATFPNQQLAEDWFNSNKASFGKLDRWIEPSEFDSGETTTSAQDSRIVEKNGQNVTEYFFPATFTPFYIDITNQVADELAVQKTLKDQENGRMVIAKIKAVNERKNLSLTDLDALMANATMMKIRACLQDGSLSTALYLIRNTDTSAFYNSSERQEIMLYIESLGYDSI